MMLTLTASQMLERWRLVAGLEPLRSDCRIEVTEGIDADRLLLERLRSWYVGLLDTADPRLLPMTDLAPLCADPAVQPDGSAIVSLPASCRRLLLLRLNGWKTPAPVLSLEDAARRLALAANPFGSPGATRPLAVQLPDGTVRALPAIPAGVVDCYVAYALAVTDPGPEQYVLDESLLSTLPPINPDRL